MKSPRFYNRSDIDGEGVLYQGFAFVATLLRTRLRAVLFALDVLTLRFPIARQLESPRAPELLLLLLTNTKPCQPGVLQF